MNLWRSVNLMLLLVWVQSVAGCTQTVTNERRQQQGDNSTASGKPIVVVGFDEHDETLEAIAQGACYGTIVQDPFNYGYQSIKLLAQIESGQPAPQGDQRFMDYPARKITRAEVESFWAEKKKNVAAGEGPAQFEKGRPSFAFVTNGIDPFWSIAEAGAKAAAREANVNVLIREPAAGIADQISILQSLIVQGNVAGVAVSPIDSENQQELLTELGEKKLFVTHDCDAPQTDRLAYIGMSNYQAGRLAGELVKQAMPEGGSVMIFVGRLGQLNAEQRRQGLIDELLDRSPDDSRRDPVENEIQGDNYTILGTQTDDFDKAKAKQQAQDAIAKYPDLGCMVGLFAYNPPLCLQAIDEAGRLASAKQ